MKLLSTPETWVYCQTKWRCQDMELKTKNMNAKKKADKLINKMYYSGRYDDKENYNPAMAWERAKQCALIAVEEIMGTIDAEDHVILYNYWQKVKSELQSF